jgi:3-oxoacyl-[acyl-carrier protein] reductase
MTKSKHVIVTGATGGIGRDLVSSLALEGNNLIITARNGDNLKLLKKEIGRISSGVDIRFACMDFSDPETHSILGEDEDITISGLVIMPPQIPATDGCFPDNSVWEDIFKTSFIGPINFIKQCVPFMDKTRIVIVSGISSAQVLSNYATSNVLRTAWLGQAKTMAAVLGPKGIHVNTLSLGGVMTDKYKGRVESRAASNGVSFDEQMLDETSNVPLRKYASTQEVSAAIGQLLGPMSDHFTGHNFICDGGFTRAY